MSPSYLGGGASNPSRRVLKGGRLSSEGPGLRSSVKDGVAIRWMGLSCLKFRSFYHSSVPTKANCPVPWGSL